MAKNKKHYLPFEKPLRDLESKMEDLKKAAEQGNVNIGQEINSMNERLDTLRKEIYEELTPLHIIQLARHPGRPTTLELIGAMATDVIEMHGDRCFGDDPAIVGGISTIDNEPIVFIGHQKGMNTKENIYRNFGSANPEGYRKALRIMKFAEKFNRPIVTFIDTQGAYPGIGAEERGQAEAIARNLREMAELNVPVICIVTGEGGSGGALGIGVGNIVLMLEYGFYSVISPEGCASILYRDASRMNEAAENLRITAKDLLEMKVIDEIIEEPAGGAHNDIPQAAENIKKTVLKHLKNLKKLSPQDLVQDRYKKFRNMGFYTEEKS
ncbi:MAG: acetyl-CoA carboxylase carboxyltransferase subunit alpha [bacterium]